MDKQMDKQNKRYYSLSKTLQTAINRIVSREPFWAKLLAALRTEIIPGDMILVSGARIEVGEDLILKYSQENFNKLITDELETVVLGSLLKIAFLHRARGKDKNQLFWNMACNIYISYLLARENYKLPKDVEPIIKEFCLDTSTEEKIYENLVQDGNIAVVSVSFEDDNDNGDHNGNDDQTNDQKQNNNNQDNNVKDKKNKEKTEKEKTELEQKAEKLNKLMGKLNTKKSQNNSEDKTNQNKNNTDSKSCDNNDNDDTLDDVNGLTNNNTSNNSNQNNKSEQNNSEQNNVDNDIDNDIDIDDDELENLIQQMLLLGQKAGNVPSYFSEKIKKLRKTNFNLKAILQDFIHESVEPNRYNWQKLNRRYLVNDNFYPTISNENLTGVVVAFDTSGSCFNEIKRIMGIIYELNEAYEGSQEPINLLYCDCGQVHHEVWRNKNDFPTPIGGGGTSYAPVMEWVRKKNSENPDQIRVLLYLTDGQCQDFGKNPEIPVIWLMLDIFNSGNQLLNVPFGKAILVPKEQLELMMA